MFKDMQNLLVSTRQISSSAALTKSQLYLVPQSVEVIKYSLTQDGEVIVQLWSSDDLKVFSVIESDFFSIVIFGPVWKTWVEEAK